MLKIIYFLLIFLVKECIIKANNKLRVLNWNEKDLNLIQSIYPRIPKDIIIKKINKKWKKKNDWVDKKKFKKFLKVNTKPTNKKFLNKNDWVDKKKIFKKFLKVNTKLINKYFLDNNIINKQYEHLHNFITNEINKERVNQNNENFNLYIDSKYKDLK